MKNEVELRLLNSLWTAEKLSSRNESENKTFKEGILVHK